MEIIITSLAETANNCNPSWENSFTKLKYLFFYFFLNILHQKFIYFELLKKIIIKIKTSFYLSESVKIAINNPY